MPTERRLANYAEHVCEEVAYRERRADENAADDDAIDQWRGTIRHNGATVLLRSCRYSTDDEEQ